MIGRHTPISRRTILRGAGASLALPWLEAMMPTRASAAARAPVRMAVLYMANGVREDMWTPTGTGRDFTLSPTLQPLANLKDELTIATNLWNQSAKGSEGHYIKTAGYLTCTTVTKTLGVDLNCHGISMDQMAAQKAGNQTPIASLELGIAPVTTGVDTNVGYTRVYGSHIAWSGPTSPVAKELNPRLVYERLLRSTKPATNSAKDDLLLLDEVQADAKQLREKLGAADRQRLDEYLSGVRSRRRTGWPRRQDSSNQLEATRPDRRLGPTRGSAQAACGARSPDARYDRSGLPDRHHSHRYVHVRQCRQQPELFIPRGREWGASFHLAPHE